MDDVCIYQIVVRDGIDEKVCNASSPLLMTVVRVEPAATLLEVSTDQAGLIGLVRHLHQKGYLLLFVCRERQDC